MKSEKNKSKFAARTTIAMLTLYAGSMIMLAACNTVEGAGKDIESAGDSIADTANDAKD
ncbi:MAG: entericidin A/B family lipoprotein [Phycisphaerales bacterium]